MLGLKKRMIQYYETGQRDGKKVKIPKSVRLACFALSQGIEDFDGVDSTSGDQAEQIAGNDAIESVEVLPNQSA